MRDPEFERWVEDARAADIMQTALRIPGANLKKSSEGLVGPCPFCGGTDRFGVNGKKRLFVCRGGGGGDVIAMVAHCMGIGNAHHDFIAACEFINGSPPPGGRQPREYDPEIARERRDERRDQEASRAAQEARKADAKHAQVLAIWERRRPFSGSPAAAYLKARGLIPLPGMADDIGFIPGLEYHGFEHEDSPNRIELGRFPCMVAAMRDHHGDITAVHRTFLSPTQPIKLIPPGDRERNKAKMVLGVAKGALIRLGPVCPIMAIGEGVETTLAWYELSLERLGDDVGAAAAYSLGNMAGRSTGTIDHPADIAEQRRRQAKGASVTDFRCRKISNGHPDMAAPGMIMPGGVEELILLGDGDSDPATTAAALLTATRRARALGMTATVSMAERGKDWNDVLLQRRDA